MKNCNIKEYAEKCEDCGFCKMNKEDENKRYHVTFIQCWEYDVVAESEKDAEDEAYEEFKNEMLSPFATTHYDNVEIKCQDGELKNG